MSQPRFRRVEARPLKHDELFESQKEVLLQALKLLHDALVNDEPPTESEGRGRGGRRRTLDRYRASPIIFINGKRGSGKTSIALTLEWILQDGGLKQFEAPTDSPFREFVDALQRRVVWLEPLDLEPLDRSTNLLAALFVRFEDVLRDIDEQRSVMRRRGVTDEDIDEAYRLLRDLEIAGAKAWAGNPVGRADRVDRNRWAEEVIEDERARRSLDRMLRQTIAKIGSLMADSPESPEKWPLFVIPVDDVDLNPERTNELLDLLRTLMGARMVFVLCGDLDVARRVLEYRKFLDLSFDNPWPRVMPPRPDNGAAPDDPFERRRNAARIAEASVRKLLPPAQRLTLRRLGLDEALNMQVAHNMDLRSVMECAKVGVWPGRLMKEGTQVPPAIELSLSDLLTEKAPGSLLLCDYPRRVADFASLAYGALIPSSPGCLDSFAARLGEHAASMVREQGVFTSADADSLGYVLGMHGFHRAINALLSVAGRGVVNLSPIRSRPKDLWRSLKNNVKGNNPGAQSDRPRPGRTYDPLRLFHSLSGASNLALVPKNEQSGLPQLDDEDSGLLGALTLGADLEALTGRGQRIHAHWTNRNAWPQPYSQWRHGKLGTYFYFWYRPEWPLYAQEQRFWQMIAESADPRATATPEHMFARWVHALVSTALDLPYQPLLEPETTADPGAATSDLVYSLNQARKDGCGDNFIGSIWVRSMEEALAAILGAVVPEAAMPDSIAKQVLAQVPANTLRGPDFEYVREKVRRWRAYRTAAFRREGSTSFGWVASRYFCGLDDGSDWRALRGPGDSLKSMGYAEAHLARWRKNHGDLLDLLNPTERMAEDQSKESFARVGGLDGADDVDSRGAKEFDYDEESEDSGIP